MKRLVPLCALLLTVACDDPVDSDPPVEISDAALPDAEPAEPDAEVLEPDAAPLEPDAAPDPTDDSYTYTATLDLPSEPYGYDPPLPAHFFTETLGFNGQRAAVDTDNTPADNPITDAGATLGRVLFYDKNLSHNRTVACASCHEAEHGFSDPRVLSVGFDGEETERHSMGLANARFYFSQSFFWDQRAATLEEQTLMPFQDPIEMGLTLDRLVERVKHGDYYPALFTAAFGDDTVDTDRIARALAQFVRSMVSVTSRYDEGRAMVASRSDPFPNFTDDENFGKFLFSMPPPAGGFGCFFCHRGEAMVGQTATNNGLDADGSLDRGFGEVTDDPLHEATFKVPSLRNIAVRPPYMHDGRFETLEEVINYYSEGIQPNPNLGLPFGVLADGTATQLDMTVAEKRAIRAFLRTLTDDAMLSDPKFSDPFVRD